jgi:glycosyltransferase involved in cell wall biosynthesis
VGLIMRISMMRPAQWIHRFVALGRSAGRSARQAQPDSQSLTTPLLGYLTSEYGRASDTFIRTEIEELRARGFRIKTFSIRHPGAEEVVDESIKAEQERTDYVLNQPAWKLGQAALTESLEHPTRFARAIALAWRSCPTGWRQIGRQLIYIVEAAYLARRMRQAGVKHLHNHIPANSASVAMLAAAMVGIEVSLTIHGPTVFYEAKRWALPVKLAQARFTVCISEFCRSQCMLYCDTNASKRLRVIRCGLPDSFFDGPNEPVPERKRFVFVGRLCREKGLVVLLQAAAQLAKRDERFELCVIGDGPERNAIKDAIIAYELHEIVRCVGKQDSAAVRDWIRSSRALVLPSFAEGLPVALMEALALRRPVVSTWIAGIPELVVPGRHGWLVPPGDVHALVDAMHAALTSDVAMLDQMGQAGAKRVRDRHHARTQAAQLEALFQEALINDGKATTQQARSITNA